MRFSRGKSILDPIYLKHSNGDFWMMGDIYEAACNCLDTIFRGRKNYFINSFSPKCIDFIRNLEYYKCAVTDKDGDVHTFIIRVVEKVPGRDTEPKPQPPPPKPVEETKAEEPPKKSEPVIEEPPPLPPSPAPVEEPILEEEIVEMKEEAKREVEIENLNIELEKENLLTTPPEFDNIPSSTDEQPLPVEKKKKARKPRKRKAR